MDSSFPVLACIAVAVLHGGAGHLPHRDNLRVRDRRYPDSAPAGTCGYWARRCRTGGRPLHQSSSNSPFADQVHHVEAEALSRPCPSRSAPSFWISFRTSSIVPVQIRLGDIERDAGNTRQTSPHTPRRFRRTCSPSWWEASPFSFALFKNIEILVLLGSPCQGLPEPLVAAGGVVEHHVQHQPDAPFVRFRGQLLKVLHGAVSGDQCCNNPPHRSRCRSGETRKKGVIQM